MFPRIINHIWLQGGIPDKYINNYNEWCNLNPNYKHNVWDEYALLQLCSQQQIEKYTQLHTLINRVNFLKYILLYNIGGIYADLDSRPLKPLDELFNEIMIFDIDTSSILSNRYPFNLEIPIKKFDYYDVIIPVRSSSMYYQNGDNPLLLDNPFLVSSLKNNFWLNLIQFCEKRNNLKEAFGTILPHEPYGPYGMTDFLYSKFKNPFDENILLIPPIYWNDPKTNSTHKHIIHTADQGW